MTLAPRKGGWRRWLLPLALVLLAALALRVVVRAPPPPPETARVAPPPPVDVAVAPGLVQSPGGEIDYGLAESGQVQAILAREGEAVRAGDPLVQLESGLQLEALRVARAELAAARARLADVRAGVRPEEVAASRAEARAAQARARRAREDLSRVQLLVRQQAATQAALDDSLREYQTQRAAAEAAARRAQASVAGATRSQVGIVEAEVQAAEARVAQAEEALARRTARAPVDARVLSVDVDPGELYSPMSPAGTRSLLVLGPLGPPEVKAEVDELFADRVALGAAAEIVSESEGRLLATGRVTSLKPLMGVKSLVTDRASEQLDRRVRETTVALDLGASLVPGQRVRVRIRLAPDERPVGAARARRGEPRR
jgi:HlyD family secretion protein